MIKQGQRTGTGSGDPSCESRAALLFSVHPGYRARHGDTNPWDLDAEIITRHPVAAVKINTICTTFRSAESDLLQGSTANDEQNAEDQKSDVPRMRPTKIVPHVMDAEYLVVDQSLHDVEVAQPVKTSPKWKLQFGDRRSAAKP